MLHAILVREMKWTWDEYQEQPVWLIQELVAYLNAEGQHQQRQQ